MDDKNTEQHTAFIRELTELTRKHGIAIGGCGCCNSPFLHKASLNVDDREGGYTLYDGGDLTWLNPDDPKDWDRNNKHIIR